MKYTVRTDQKKRSFKIDRKKNDFVTTPVDINIDKKNYSVQILESNNDGTLKSVRVNNKIYSINIEKNQMGLPKTAVLNGIPYDVSIEKVESTRFVLPAPDKKVSGEIRAILPGQIIAILVEENTKVKEGTPLFILEAMKMENEILAHKDGVIKKIAVSLDQLVMKNDLLIEIT